MQSFSNCISNSKRVAWINNSMQSTLLYTRGFVIRIPRQPPIIMLCPPSSAPCHQTFPATDAMAMACCQQLYLLLHKLYYYHPGEFTRFSFFLRHCIYPSMPTTERGVEQLQERGGALQRLSNQARKSSARRTTWIAGGGGCECGRRSVGRSMVAKTQFRQCRSKFLPCNSRPFVKRELLVVCKISNFVNRQLFQLRKLYFFNV